MSDVRLEALSDLVTDAHTRIQQSFAQLNPVVAVRRGMRDTGIPADAITIDCLASQKRIVLILHDDQRDALIYQFTTIDADDDPAFQQLPWKDVTVEVLFQWMATQFL